MGMGVSHTSIYDFMDDANQTFGIVDASLNQKQSYRVVQRIVPWLSDSVQTGDMFVNPMYSDITFDYANFYGFSFQNGSVSVGVAWTGDSYPSEAFFTSHQGRLSFTHPGTHSVVALNAVTGATNSVAWSQYRNRVIVPNAQVTNEPILYIAK
jgi:hypothetical protein